MLLVRSEILMQDWATPIGKTLGGTFMIRQIGMESYYGTH